MLQRIVYWLFRLAISVGAVIPFSILYYIADGLAFFLQYILKYRKKVVYQNIRHSFPQYSEATIQAIVKKFYQNLADIILEGLKGYTYSPSKLSARYRFKPSPTLDLYYEKGQSVLFVGGHFANWEWGIMCGALQSRHHIMCYYQPIKNKLIDNFYRKQFSTDRNVTNISKKNAVRNFVQVRHQTVGHLLIADQSPNSRKNGIWLNFLNQDTICIIGPEKLAQRFNYPVFYVHIERIKRGFYEIELILLENAPKDTPTGDITARYMKMLEQQIKETPYNWLWSHKRWKKKRLVE